MHGCLYFSRSGMAGRRRDAFFCFILLGIAAPFVIQCAAEGIISKSVTVVSVNILQRSHVLTLFEFQDVALTCS